jgi:hypothetical protein
LEVPADAKAEVWGTREGNKRKMKKGHAKARSKQRRKGK